MHLPPSISFLSFFMNFTSAKMLFRFCSILQTLFSFFSHRISNHFLCSIFDILMFSLFSSDQFLHIFLYATFFCCAASFTSSFHRGFFIILPRYSHDFSYISSFHILYHKLPDFIFKCISSIRCININQLLNAFLQPYFHVVFL